MRVLHIIGPVEYGGAQTQLLGLLRAANGRHWEASMCSTAPGALLPSFRELGIPMLELRRVASPGLARFAKVRRTVNSGRYDVIHSILWHSNAYVRLATLGRNSRPAVAISERGVERRPQSRIRIDKLLAPWTDLYIANSEAVAEFMRSVHPIREGYLQYLENAVDRSVFYPGAPRVDRGPFRFGSVGRLEHEKGFDILIEAARTVRDLKPHVEIVVVGDGSLRAELEAKAEGTVVRFLGALEPGQAVADFLRSLDVFVLPSRTEGRPNAVIEALACGLPVVASDVPGVAEAMGEGGRLVLPASPMALAEALVEAADAPHLRAHSRARAPHVPSFEDLAVRYARAFELAIRHRDTARSNRRSSLPGPVRQRAD